MSKRPPLVLVEWEDSYNGDHSWFDLDEMPKEPIPAILFTTGFLVRECKKRITLVMSYQCDDHDGVRACDVFVIPKGCIRKRTVLRK